MPYGRGGAGNYEAAQVAKQVVQTQKADDIEAQRTGPDISVEQIVQARAAAQYARSGRGGAGNYYSPRELSKTGHFEATTPDAQQTSIGTTQQMPIKAQATLPAYRGRGGAGNYQTSAADSARDAQSQAQKEEHEQEQRRAAIMQDVESGLARPERAKLPGVDP